jgi:hypothetical protein
MEISSVQKAIIRVVPLVLTSFLCDGAFSVSQSIHVTNSNHMDENVTHRASCFLPTIAFTIIVQQQCLHDDGSHQVL